MSEDQRIQWGDDGISNLDISLGQPYEVKQAAYQEFWLNRLGFPQDMHGKRVLECFSGGSNASFRHAIEDRGGTYFSIDSDPEDKNGINHITGDVFDEVKRLALEGEQFDYVLMKYPPLWGGQFEEREVYERQKKLNRDGFDWKDYPQLRDLITNLVTITKPTRGNSINILGGASRGDSDVLYKNLPKVLGNDWYVTHQFEKRARTKVRRDNRGAILRKENRVPELELQDEFQIQILRK